MRLGYYLQKVSTAVKEQTRIADCATCLLIDLVGYSKLLIEEQKERLRQLTDIVLSGTAQVREDENERTTH